ncbi:MAG: glycosyl hydrolase [Terrimicrobiaceae bacterium]
MKTHPHPQHFLCKNKTFLILAAILPFLPGTGRAEDWKPVIEDSFTVTGDRPADAPLAGTLTEKGGRVWLTKGNAALFKLSPDGTVANGNINGGKMAALVDCVPEGDYQIRLEADIQPGGAQWLGMGFSKGKDLFWSKETPGQLWLVITKGGQVQIYADGTSKTLKNVKPADFGFDPEKPVHAEILYDRPANTVTVTLNGQKVLDALALGEFKPEIKTAGIMDNFPLPNDPKMLADNFKVSLQNGTMSEPKAWSGKPAILIDSTAVKATNLYWGGLRSGGAGPTIDLQAESSLTPFEPYYAKFAFDIKPEAAGEYDAWALVFGTGDVPHLSAWDWSFDGAAPQEGKALEGSLKGMPRWVKFARVDLKPGEHSLHFTVTKRRSFPDDAFLFHLYKVILSPAGEEFTPEDAAIDLGFNPQGNQAAGSAGGAGSAKGQPGRTVLLRSALADPVTLSVDPKKVLPPIQPVWRDLSEGGPETGGDFLIPELAKPLRPRFIRKCHILSLAKISRGADGKLNYDFSESLAAVRAILAVKAEPIVDFSTVPGPIRTDAKNKPLPVAEWAKSETFQKEWAETVTAFLQALKDNNLPVRYFTSFNEPEFSGMKTNGENATSLMIWRVAAQAVKDFDPKLQMAGMEFGNAKSGIYQAFLEEIGKDSKNIDIFSFHQYNSTSERQAAEIKDLRAELDKRGLQRVKIAVDEWGVVSSGQPYHRATTRAATYNASNIKAMAEAGLDIGGFFCFRDYPNPGWKWGMITGDGYLKPSYWGHWLWAQLPETNDRLAVTGGNDHVQSIAFRDGAGITMLVWYDAPENSPIRDVSINLAGEQWAGYTVTQWQLDSMRHIGYIPPGAPVELPHSVKSEKFKAPALPSFSFKMLPASMRLVKMQPLAADQEPVPPRPLLLDNEGLSTGKFRNSLQP